MKIEKGWKNICRSRIRSALIPLSIGFCLFFATGCKSTTGNAGHIGVYPVASMESEWIRNGEPIEFEEQKWYPVDDVENFMDSEMYLAGEYRGVQFFIDRVDVRPYDRLYTKFGRNRFRFFEQRKDK